MQYMEMPQDPSTPVAIPEFKNHKRLKGNMGKLPKTSKKGVPDRSSSTMERPDATSDKTSILTPPPGQKTCQPSIVDLCSSQDTTIGQTEVLR